ncbi:MAG: TrkA C-terminal domain-containing protein [Actinomycetota bacterium]|nr:TrkA C-terminal domain-containing protein [Actinomycetota bacterium]
MQANLRRISELGGTTGISEVLVAENSSIDQAPVRSAAIPRGVLITAIERGSDVIRPNGDTIIQPGDRLMVLGTPDDLAILGQLASSTSR